MARPSLDSPSMVELAIQAKNRRKSSPPTSMPQNSMVAPKLPVFHFSRSANDNGKSRSNLSGISDSNLAQNLSLAKNNSILLTKISNLESKINELISENMSIRRQKSLKEIEIKETLDKKLRTIEDGLYHKFSDIFQMFSDIRQREDLGENTKLRVFTENNKPGFRLLNCIRSPVLTQDGATRRNSAYNIEEPLEQLNILGESSPLRNRSDGTKRDPPSPTRATERVLETLFESLEKEVSTEKVKEPEKIPEEEVEKVGPKTSELQSKTMATLIQTPTEMTSSRRKSKAPQDSPCDNIQIENQKQVSISESQSLSVRLQNPTRKRSSHAITENSEATSVQQENLKPFEVFQEPRTRRNRKEVDYTVNLRKKLRREAGLVTAVGDEPLSRRQSIKEEPPRKSDQKERKPLTSLSLNRRSTTFNVKPTKPSLTQVEDIATSKNPSSTTTEDDLSIFDFENAIIHPPKKTYAKRRITLDPRRHSMV